MHYTPAKLARYCGEHYELTKALEPGEKFADMSVEVVGNFLDDLLEAHEKLAVAAAHKCAKSKFLPGVVVGAGIILAIGYYDDRKRKNA
jgi:hypothetical protein